MFLREDQLEEIKVRFEDWKWTNDFYPKRVKQIEEFVELGRGVVWHAIHSGELTNEKLTALIQVLRANASWTVINKYLPILVSREKDLEVIRGEFSITETRGFTGVGRNVIHGLKEENLKAVHVLLQEGEEAKTREEAQAIVARFEASNVRFVKSGIYSPWLYYLKPDLFPISNESHKAFRQKYGFPQPYTERMPGYWQLADHLDVDLGVLDAFIHSSEWTSAKAVERKGDAWYEAPWMKSISRTHWEHFLETCASFLERFDIDSDDPILGITPRTDNAKRISVNLGNRLVLGLEHKQKTMAIIMLGPDAGERFNGLTDWDYFNSKPDAHLWGLPYDRFIELHDELMSECLTLSNEFKQGKRSSPYRKHHVADLYDMAVDQGFREIALDHMLEGKGEWPGHETIRSVVSEPTTEYGTNYWWLNANPSIWSITDTPLHSKQSYSSHNDKGNKRRVFKHFQTVKPGDLMVGYESSPSKQIKGLFKVTKALHTADDGKENFEFELTEKFAEPISYDEVVRLPELEACEPVLSNQGSLFKLTQEEFEVIRELIDSKQERVPKGIPRYDYENDPDKPFLSETAFAHLVKQLRRKKNLVLQGPPGVGKTFIARKLAYALMQEVDDSRIDMVQFHQSTSYEDFIQGLRPAKNGGFELRNGVFYTFCQRAHANPDKDFFFIIDEINRGNLSKIFGELMLLIEHDKRHRKYALKLTYAEDEADTFWVPPNVHLIGTMNTADRSLAIVDYALRRRFAFVELEPDLGERFRSFLTGKGLAEELVDHLIKRLAEVNKHIRDDRDLGPGFQIGHSYFCGERNGQDAEGWYSDVLTYEIRPLLQEIWFDDLDKAKKMFSLLEK